MFFYDLPNFRVFFFVQYLFIFGVFFLPMICLLVSIRYNGVTEGNGAAVVGNCSPADCVDCMGYEEHSDTIFCLE